MKKFIVKSIDALKIAGAVLSMFAAVVVSLAIPLAILATVVFVIATVIKAVFGL